MPRCQSPTNIVQSAVPIKSWIERTPSVEETRPSHCPRCEAPSQLVGAPLGLHGHGRRERQLRGPLVPGQEPELVVIAVRRYRCQHCSATTTVVPRGVLPRRLFSAAAIGLALCLLGLLRLSVTKVREQVSPWRCIGAAAATGWAQLRRWTDAVRERRLFGGVVCGPLPAARRDVAGRAAQALSTRCPPQQFFGSMTEQVFVGAAQAP